MIDRLHYISQETATLSHTEMAKRACKAGVRWVQLRVKDKPESEILQIAKDTLTICRNYGARLIINDHVAIAHAIGADGVHLGQTDNCPAEARKALGADMIVGGTANTFDQIQALHEKKVDYMGVGPFRFTNTKTNLSPVLGLKGYAEIIHRCKASGINTPIIAIGGILPEDVPDIMKTGVHGIAVASVINGHEEPLKVVEKLTMSLS